MTDSAGKRSSTKAKRRPTWDEMSEFFGRDYDFEKDIPQREISAFYGGWDGAFIAINRNENAPSMGTDQGVANTDSARDKLAAEIQASNPHASPLYSFRAGWDARDEEVKRLRSALHALVNSEVVKNAPFITYSEAYDNARQALAEQASSDPNRICTPLEMSEHDRDIYQSRCHEFLCALNAACKTAGLNLSDVLKDDYLLAAEEMNEQEKTDE